MLVAPLAFSSQIWNVQVPFIGTPSRRLSGPVPPAPRNWRFDVPAKGGLRVSGPHSQGGVLLQIETGVSSSKVRGPIDCSPNPPAQRRTLLPFGAIIRMTRSGADPSSVPVVWMPVTFTSPTTLPLNFLPTVMVELTGVAAPLAGPSGMPAFG